MSSTTRKVASCLGTWILPVALGLALGCSSTGNPTHVPAEPGTVALTPGTPASATVDTGGGTSLTFAFPGDAVTQAATVDITPTGSASHPLVKGPQPAFTLNAGNTYVLGFSVTMHPATVTDFEVPIPVSGNVGSTIAAGTTLNLAWWNTSMSTWLDVATFVDAAGGAITENLLSSTLIGLRHSGDYVLYIPGNTTTVSNLGIALIGDDGNGNGVAAGSLQVVHLFNGQGQPLATPTISYLTFQDAGDMDGQALTPDGSQGIVVDGGNTVRFFSAVQTGVPMASTNTLDIGNYGGDGDSIAIMPDGKEAVVSGDSDSVLLVVSGIKAGAPATAETIPIPGARDGLVISNDGLVMLARGYDGLTAFSIQPITPVAGSLGGQIAHSYTQTADSATNAALASVGDPSNEDGRDGMAFSPVDSSRAVVVGQNRSTNLPQITLLTGLPTTPAATTPLTIPVASEVMSVAVSPDGTMVVVGTSSGLALYTGVNTGTLTQVGSGLYSPAFSVGSNSYPDLAPSTLGITLDGKYVIAGVQADDSSFTLGNGVLLTIPFTSSGFSAPVGQLNDVAIPDNDQIVLH